MRLSHSATAYPAAAIAAVLAVGVPVSDPASAQDIAGFYKGKQLNIIVGYGPGGAYDAYARALAGHWGRFIPGNPQIVVQYMPGAGSLVAANHIARVAPADGTSIGVFSLTTALAPVFGNKAAQFDPLKLTWIGNMFSDAAGCATWSNSGVTSLKEMVGAKQETVFGATGPDASGTHQALTLKSILGANIKLITGYKGIKEVALALEKGEIAVACSMSVGAVRSAFDADYQSGRMKMIVQLGRQKEPYFRDTPHIYTDFKLSDEQRAVADLVFGQSDVSRPFIGPPGMPPPVVAALRSAFMEALADKAFAADAERMKVDVTPMSGEATAQRVADFTRAPPAVVEQVKSLLGLK